MIHKDIGASSQVWTCSVPTFVRSMCLTRKTTRGLCGLEQQLQPHEQMMKASVKHTHKHTQRPPYGHTHTQTSTQTPIWTHKHTYTLGQRLSGQVLSYRRSIISEAADGVVTERLGQMCWKRVNMVVCIHLGMCNVTNKYNQIICNWKYVRRISNTANIF